MAPEKDYSLISVSSDEEDDVVIQAGFAGPASGGASSDEDAIDEAQEGAVEGSDVQQSKGADEQLGGKPTKQSANAMLTTEEDLKAPMPYANMQRIILGVFALLIVAFVLYWFFIR